MAVASLPSHDGIGNVAAVSSDDTIVYYAYLANKEKGVRRLKGTASQLVDVLHDVLWLGRCTAVEMPLQAWLSRHEGNVKLNRVEPVEAGASAAPVLRQRATRFGDDKGRSGTGQQAGATPSGDDKGRSSTGQQAGATPSGDDKGRSGTGQQAGAAPSGVGEGCQPEQRLPTFAGGRTLSDKFSAPVFKVAMEMFTEMRPVTGITATLIDNSMEICEHGTLRGTILLTLFFEGPEIKPFFVLRRDSQGEVLPYTDDSLRRCIASIMFPSKALIIALTTELGENVPTKWFDQAYTITPTDAFAKAPNSTTHGTDKQSTVVVVCGETGIGKSTLVAHLLPESFRGKHHTLYVSLSKFDETALDACSPLKELNSTDDELVRLSGRFAALISDEVATDPVVKRLHKKCLQDDTKYHAYRNFRATESQELVERCLDAALARQCPDYARWKANPDKEKETVTLAIDEIGKCLALVRGIVSQPMNDVQARLKEKFGFDFVNIVFAGTGTEAFQARDGALRVSTDPDRIALVHLLPPLDGRAFANWALPDHPEWIDVSIAQRLSALWTNARMAVEFASEIKRRVTSDVSADAAIYSAAQSTMVHFVKLNGLGTLPQERRNELIHAAYWTLFEPRQSNVDTTMYSGSLTSRDGTPMPDEVRRRLQEECRRLGLLRMTGDTYVVSPAIKFALCTNLGVYVKPAMGDAFEDLCARAAARGCQMQGFDTLLVKLSMPYLRAASNSTSGPSKSYIVKSEAELIINHLRRGKTASAVVILNGPCAQGPDVIVLKLRKTRDGPLFEFIAVQAKNTTSVDAKDALASIGLGPEGSRERRPKTAMALYAFEMLARQAVAVSPPPKKLDVATGRAHQFKDWKFVVQSSLPVVDRAELKSAHGRATLFYRDHLGPWKEFFDEDTNPENHLFSCSE